MTGPGHTPLLYRSSFTSFHSPPFSLYSSHTASLPPGTQQGAPSLGPFPRNQALQIAKQLISSSSALKPWNEWQGLLWKEPNWTSAHGGPTGMSTTGVITSLHPKAAGPHLREWPALLHFFSWDTPYVRSVTTCCEFCLLNISPNHSALPTLLPAATLLQATLVSPASLKWAPHWPSHLQSCSSPSHSTLKTGLHIPGGQISL